MAPPGAVAPNLSDTQLAELLSLAGDADSVELKVTVPESEHFQVATSLGMDPLDAQIRQVYFFDTPDLMLDRQGVVLRARRIQGKSGDSIVKLRPVVPGEIQATLRESQGFNVEIDALPGGYVCSARSKREVGNADIREAVSGMQPLGRLFSKAQRAVLGSRSAADVEPDDLFVLGPILVLKLKFAPEGLERRLVVELWMYPDGSRVLELSTRCEPRDAFMAAAETRVFLSQRGVELSGEQQAKTRKALEFFSARMVATRKPSRGGT
jgi:hypothetical protein